MTALGMCLPSPGRFIYYHLSFLSFLSLYVLFFFNLIYVCSCSDYQVQAQTEAITEDDLRLIQERESSIRQLEVQKDSAVYSSMATN